MIETIITCPFIKWLLNPNPKQLNALENSVINYNSINEFDCDIIDIKDNKAIFILCDLDSSNKLFKIFSEKYNNLDFLQNSNLFDVKNFSISDQTIFYIFTKNYFWDQPSYEDIFKCLQKLRQILDKLKIKTISIPNLNSQDNNQHQKWHKILSMIRYLFRKTNITINIYHNNIVNLTPDQIQNVLREFHSNPSSGHSGYHRTYKGIKERYKWHNMK